MLSGSFKNPEKKLIRNVSLRKLNIFFVLVLGITLFLCSSGLWLYLHQCVWTKGSSGTLHKGLSAFYFSLFWKNISLYMKSQLNESLHMGYSPCPNFLTTDCFKRTNKGELSMFVNQCVQWIVDKLYIPGSDNNNMCLIPNQGDFEAGKYRCLICNKEFNSESGVKYHINSVHSQVRFTRKVFLVWSIAGCLFEFLSTLSSSVFNRTGLWQTKRLPRSLRNSSKTSPRRLSIMWTNRW